MKRLLLSSFLLFVLVTGAGIFSPTDSSFIGFNANKLCADEVLQRGIRCEVQYSDCQALGSNWANLLQDVRSGKISVTTVGQGTSEEAKQQFIKSIQKEHSRAFKGRDSQICYNTNVVKDIVETIIGGTNFDEYNQGDLDILTNYDTGNDFSVFRACPINYSYSRNSKPEGNGFLGNTVYTGCCPNNYRIVLNTPISSLSIGSQAKSNGTACCLAVDGLDPYWYYPAQEQCLDKNRQPTYNSSSYNFQSKSLPIAIIGVPERAGWDSSDWDDFNGKVSLGSGSLSDSEDPERGILKISKGARAPLACPASSVCAIDATGNLDSVKSATGYSQIGSTAICGRCFMDGQLIGTSDPGVAGQKGFARFCDSKSPNGLYRDDELIGGSGDITQGAGLEDPDNQILYKACFDSGGIYTAIGCVDPTPTGIITGLIRIALGVMGGIALMQMVYVGILYQMGDTEKIKKARSQLFATLSGLFVLVFSILILRIIGVNILDVIPQGSV